MTRIEFPYHASCLIGGSEVDVPQRAEIWNPASLSEVVGSYPLLSAGDVDSAVKSAARAQKEWARYTAAERAQILDDAAKQVGEIGGLAELLVCEQGKVRMEAGFEIAFLGALTGYFTGQAAALDDVPPGKVRVFREPVGVVAVITPSSGTP